MNVLKRMAGGALMMTLLVTVAVAQVAAIDGEVIKINEGSGNITLKHGPAPSLGFKEAVTMVYEIRDNAMLKQLVVPSVANAGDGGELLEAVGSGLGRAVLPRRPDRT